MSKPDHHYFASFAFGWKIAPTRDKAIKGLVEGFRPDVKTIMTSCHKNGRPGAYIWSCRVEVPIDTPYEISFFAPTGVAKSESEEHFVTYVTNKKIAYYTEGDNKC